MNKKPPPSKTFNSKSGNSKSAAEGSSLLKNKVAIVTGAGGGVGKGIAAAMAEAGAKVVIAARRAETGQPAADEINEAGGEAVFMGCDVAKREDIHQVIEGTASKFGKVDCFVHNALAPVGPPSLIPEIKDELFESMYSTAVAASFDSAQLAYPHLKKSEGSLILLTSAAGMEGSWAFPLYGAVKAAQRGLAKSLAREWGADKIRVNLLSPVAMTEAMERAYENYPELQGQLMSQTALGRIGDPAQDIGPAVVFLASDMARFISGQTLTVDGGKFMP